MKKRINTIPISLRPGNLIKGLEHNLIQREFERDVIALFTHTQNAESLTAVALNTHTHTHFIILSR